MFVRFRKVPCDGYRPWAAAHGAAHVACRKPYGVVCNRCSRRPRCRWRIGQDETLIPYTLKVYLIENTRRDGKVKQEIIAFLGRIDATCLPAFWSGIDSDRLHKIRAAHWQRQAIEARAAFWRQAGPRLDQLVNRLGPDMKRIRMAVHARIPWPMQPERDRLDQLKAQAEARSWKQFYDHTAKMIESNERLMESAKKQNMALRQDALREIRLATEWAEKAEQLEKTVSKGPDTQ